jgi:hypothetical protein
VGNIERCKGFTEHLMSLVVDQYSGLAEIHKAYIELRYTYKHPLYTKPT